MVGVEQQGSLRYIKCLIHSGVVQMDLWENGRGDLFISLPAKNKDSIVYFETSSESLMQFFAGNYTLQQLYFHALSPFVELMDNGRRRQLYQPDADLELLYGEQRLQELQQLK